MGRLRRHTKGHNLLARDKLQVGNCEIAAGNIGAAHVEINVEMCCGRWGWGQRRLGCCNAQRAADVVVVCGCMSLWVMGWLFSLAFAVVGLLLCVVVGLSAVVSLLLSVVLLPGLVVGCLLNRGGLLYRSLNA